MKKLIFAAFLAVIASSVAFGQNNTTYFDANWQKTSKDSAAFYRPAPKAKGSGYWIQDYYISGTLQMEGLSTSNTEDIFDGEITWYHENGKLMQKAMYVNGAQEGELINYNTDGIEISRGVTKEGVPFSGSFYEEGNSFYTLKFYENGVMQKYSSIANSGSSKARVDAFYKDGIIVEAAFYNQAGELIGKSTVDENEVITDGVMVSYYFNPMMVESVQHIMDGKYTGPTTGYFTNGKIKFCRYFNDNKKPVKEIYFNTKGQRVDSISFQDSKPLEGVMYTFPQTYNSVATVGDRPLRIVSYQDGLMNGPEREFYPNGSLKSSATYEDNMLSGTRTTYDSTGVVKYTMVYKDGKPYEGTFIDWDNAIQTYKDGGLTEETRFHPNGKVMLVKKVSEGVTVFDSRGKILSKLVYKDGEPYEGKTITLYEDVVTFEETYKAGQKVSEIYYNEGKPTEKLVYNNNQKIRTLYYANGKPKQETKYIDDNEREITCFATNGTLLGKLQINESYELSGTKCIFDEDSIAEITEYANNNVVRSKKFFNNALLCDVNYYGNSLFNDPYEKKTYTCIFRDGKPYTGTEVEYDDYNKTIKRISNYLNGKLHGQQIWANYNYDTGKSEISHTEQFVGGIKTGMDKEFYNENLMKETAYKNGFREGETRYYNKEGKVIATGIYKDDLPWSGKFVDYTYDYEIYTEASYANGKLEGANNTYSEGVLNKADLYKEGIIEKAVWYANGEPQYTLLYRNGEPFNGTEKSYDELNIYKNGVLTERLGMDFSNDFIKSREIFNGNNGSRTTYYANGKVKSVLHLQDYSKQGKAVYYDADGKILGEGEYANDVPIAGKFVFYHSEGEDARVELMVNAADFTAVEIVENTPARRLKYEILSGKDEAISAARERFARMLADTFEGYDISVSY